MMQRTQVPSTHVARVARLALVLMVTAWAAGCGEPPSDVQGHDAHRHDDGHDHAHDQGEPSAAAILAAHRHDEPGQTCFMCDPAQRDKGRLWCKEHVRYEDRCWLCHPELEDKTRAYCGQHFLYVDECTLCNPSLKVQPAPASRDEHDGHNHADDDHAGHNHGDTAHTTGPDGRIFCNEHGVYEDECAICQPELTGSLQPGGSLKIRFPSETSAHNAGVRTAAPQTLTAAPTVEALCEVQYNLNALARVTPLAGGVIRRVHHDVGDTVTAGELLAELHSADVAAAKSDYLAALVESEIRAQALEREKRLREQNLAPERDFLEAQASSRAASLAAGSRRQHLANLGFTDEDIRAIEKDRDTTAWLAIRAPFDGTIVERAAVEGEAVAEHDAVFTVADLSTRWLLLSVPSRYIAQVQRGQAVQAVFEELPDIVVEGRITWIDTAIDPRSRMLKVRAVATHEVDRIKTGLFGKARIAVGEARTAAQVPPEAVQHHQGADYVFVRDEADLFSLRRVTLGQSSGDAVEIMAGLSADDAVVTEGSFIVMSQFLKSRLGAGCADH